MASFYYEFQNGYRLGISYTQDSCSIEKNTSDVTVEVFLQSIYTSCTISSSATKKVTLSIDGASYSYSAAGLARLSGNQKKTIFTKSLTVQHDEEGRHTLRLYCTFDIDVTLGSTHFSSVRCPSSGTKSVELPVIPRPSAISPIDCADVGSTANLTIQRASGDYTHTLSYSTDGRTFTTFAEEVGASYSWPVPDRIAELFPSAAAGDLYLRCQTWYGGEAIATRDLRTRWRVTEDYARPALTISATQVNRAGFDACVTGESTVTLRAKASLRCGAAARSYSFAVGERAYSVYDANSAYDYAFLLPSGDAAQVQVRASVTDSRGFRSEPAALELDVLAYSPPEITSIQTARGRMEPDPETLEERFVEDVEGDRLRVTAEGRISPLNGMNARRYAADYRVNSEREFVELFPETELDGCEFRVERISEALFSPELAYVARFIVSDSFNSATEILQLSSQQVLLNFSPDGRAICAGGMATYEDTFQSWLNFLPSGGITATQIPEGQGVATITTSGWYYGEAQAGGGLPIESGKYGLYVEQIGDNVRCQQLRHYDGALLRTFVRCGVNSGWGEWREIISGSDITLGDIRSGGGEGSVAYTHEGKLSSLRLPEARGSYELTATVGDAAALSWEARRKLADLIEEIGKVEALRLLGVYYADSLPAGGEEGDICLIPV